MTTAAPSPTTTQDRPTTPPPTTDEIQATLHLVNSDRFAGSGAVDSPPRTLAELLAHHAQAALELSGADQTAWNSQVVEAGEGILGLAHWDGTLHLDRECILDPLHEMYRHSGKPQSDAALIRYREALVTVLHEQSHFLGPTGATQEAARDAFKGPGSRALEEGVAEAWAQTELDDYLTRLGIDQVAPGIDRVATESSYQAFVPAVLVLTSDLDERADLPDGETLRALNCQTAEGQWPQVVDLVYRSSRLPDCVPPAREPVVRLRLENTLRESFKGLEELETLPRGFAASRSLSAGRQCVTRLNEEIKAAELYFQPPTAADRSPDAAFHSAFSGLAPPGTPANHQQATGDSPAAADHTTASAPGRSRQGQVQRGGLDLATG